LRATCVFWEDTSEDTRQPVERRANAGQHTPDVRTRVRTMVHGVLARTSTMVPFWYNSVVSTVSIPIGTFLRKCYILYFVYRVVLYQWYGTRVQIKHYLKNNLKYKHSGTRVRYNSTQYHGTYSSTWYVHVYHWYTCTYVHMYVPWYGTS
jgi:hypothetical protein